MLASRLGPWYFENQVEDFFRQGLIRDYFDGDEEGLRKHLQIEVNRWDQDLTNYYQALDRQNIAAAQRYARKIAKNFQNAVSLSALLQNSIDVLERPTDAVILTQFVRLCRSYLQHPDDVKKSTGNTSLKLIPAFYSD
jgi:hypothetical protein